MFNKFKSCKSSSKGNQNLLKIKSNSKPKQIRYPLKDFNIANDQNCEKKKNQNLLSTTETQSEKQNIYYTPIVKASANNDQNRFGIRNSSTRQKRTINFFKTQRQKAQSSESSNSYSPLKKNDLGLKNYESSKSIQNPQKQNIYQSCDFITSSHNSKKLSNKQISTKTSIKQIQQCHSSSKKRINKSPIINRRQQQKKSTLQIAMKNMLSQLKEVRKQNVELKNELIEIRSQQFYILDRSKVKQMVIELEKQKQIRVKVQKQNIKLQQQNQRLKESFSQVKKQNIRFKRINADMKRTIINLDQQNKILRQRKWAKQQRQDSCDYSQY